MSIDVTGMSVINVRRDRLLFTIAKIVGHDWDLFLLGESFIPM